MFCDHCGKKNNKNSKFCSFCGASLQNFKKELLYNLKEILNLEVTKKRLENEFDQNESLLNENLHKLDLNLKKEQNLKNYHHREPNLSFFLWVQDYSLEISIAITFLIGVLLLVLSLLDIFNHFSFEIMYLISLFFGILLSSFAAICLLALFAYVFSIVIYLFQFFIRFLYKGLFKICLCFDNFLCHHFFFYEKKRNRKLNNRIKEVQKEISKIKEDIRKLESERNRFKKEYHETQDELASYYRNISLSSRYQNINSIYKFIEYLENGSCDTLKECMNKFDLEVQNKLLQNKIHDTMEKVEKTNENTLVAIEESRRASDMAYSAMKESKGAKKAAMEAKDAITKYRS